MDVEDDVHASGGLVADAHRAIGGDIHRAETRSGLVGDVVDQRNVTAQ